MAIWFVFALMTGLVIWAVLWPLSRRTHAPAGQVDERAFYQQRLAEIGRDAATGYIGATEAEAARAEAARRLLRESRSAPSGLADGESEYALRRRRAASAIALSTVPLIALAVYGAVGSPDMKSLPVAERHALPADKMTPDELVARMERHLATTPADGAGWELLAPVYQRLGRRQDAVRAWANAVRLQGENPARLAGYGEALVAAADGVVEASARDLFVRAARTDPSAPMPRFYLAVAQAQDGDAAGARKSFEALLKDAPAGAPWRAAVEARLAVLQRQAMADDIASAPKEAQTAAIAGMVDGLAARLAENPDNPEGWRMLVRSYVTLGQQDAASEALASGLRAMAAHPDELGKLTSLARELGISLPDAPKP